MRDGFQMATLGDVCNLTKGATPTMKARPGRFPLVVTAADRSSSDEYQFDGEAVCVPMVSSTGHGHASLKRVHYESGQFAVANIITACTAKPGAPINMKYLWLVLDHSRDELIVPLMKGTANVSLSQKNLATVRFPLPGLPQQERIVDLISSLDSTIEATEDNRREARNTLARVRHRIFSGFMEAHSTSRADDVFQMLLGRQKSARQSVGHHVIPYIRAANISDAGFRLGDVQTMNFSPKEQERYCIRAGDVLLVEGGSLGQSAIWGGDLPGPVGFDKHVIRLRPLSGASSAEFVFHWTKWAYETGQFDAQATGVTIRALGFGRASAMQVPNVPAKAQLELLQPLEAFEATWAQTGELLERTVALRSNLLTALLSGAHQIPDFYDSLIAEAA